MHYIIYKITNKINGKIYIGQHMTNDLNDDYMGSGIVLRKEQKYQGIENFEKKILYVYETFIEMDQKERELVTMDFIKRNDTYNMVPGGSSRTCICPDCGKEFTIKVFSRHLNSKQCLKNQKIIEIGRNKGECFHCKMDISLMTTSARANHTRWCDKNPKRQEYVNSLQGESNPMFGKVGWKKGLTKETDERIKRTGQTYHNRIKSGEIIPTFLGKSHSLETKQKISEKMKKIKNN